MARRPLLFFALGLLLVAAGLATVLYHPALQSFTAQRVAAYLTNLTGFNISIRRIEIPLQGREILIHDVAVEVPTGHVALSARRVAVEMDLAALGGGALSIPRIHIDDAYAGVYIRDGRAEPVETILEAVAKLTAGVEPAADDEPSSLQLGTLSWSNVHGYFWHEDPSMVGTTTLSGSLDLSQWPIRGPYQGQDLEYMVLDWPFTAHETQGLLTIGDWVKLEGTLPTSMPHGNLRYSVEVSTATGDVVVHAAGELDTGIVPAHFAPYPYLEGTATVDVSLGDDDAFWLQARVSSQSLRLEEHGRVERLHVRMDMNDERMQFTEIRGNIVDLDAQGSGQLDVTGSIVFGPPVDLYFGGKVQGLDLAHVRQTFSPVDLDQSFTGSYDGQISAALRVTDSVSIAARLDGRATALSASMDDLAHRDASVRVRAAALIETDPFALDLSVAEWRGQTSAIAGVVLYSQAVGLELDMHGHLGSESLPWSQWLPVVDQVGDLNFVAQRRGDGQFTGSFTAQGLRLPWLKDAVESQARVTSEDGRHFRVADTTLRAGDNYVQGAVQVDLDRQRIKLAVEDAHFDLGSWIWSPDLAMRGDMDFDGALEYQWDTEWITALDIRSFAAPALVLEGPLAITLPALDCAADADSTMQCLVGDAGQLAVQAHFEPHWNTRLGLEMSQLMLEQLWLAGMPLRLLLDAQVALQWRAGRLALDGSLDGSDVWLDKYLMGSVRSDFSAAQTADDWDARFSLTAAQDVTHFAAVFQRDPVHDQSQSLWILANLPSQYDLLDDGSLGIAGSGEAYLRWQKHELQQVGFHLTSFALRQAGAALAVLAQPVALELPVGQDVRQDLLWQFRDENQQRLWPLTLRFDSEDRWSLRALASAPLRGLEGFVPLIRFGEGSVAGDTEFGRRADGFYLSGDLSLTPAPLSLPELGVSGRLLAGRARLQDWRIDLSDIEVQTDSGALDGSARINLGDPALSLSAELGLDNITVSPAPGIEARLSGPLTLQFADPGPMYVRGKLDLLSGLLNDRIDWEQSLLRFQRRDKRALSSVQDAPVILQLVLANDGALKIDNNLAKLTVDGNFMLVGAADNPGIMGNLSAEGGDLFWQGQVYSIENALVQFVDPLVLNPQVDVRAKTSVEEQSSDELGLARDYQVVLHAHGELESLQIDYDSDPYLPKEEIVSLLNFGVTNLSGGSGTAGVTNFLLSPQLAPIESAVEDLIGFDSFDLRQTYNRQSEVNTMSVRLQKRFTNKLRMSVESSVDQVGGQRVGFDYGITRSLSLSLGWDNDAVEQTGNFSLQPRLRIPLP